MTAGLTSVAKQWDWNSGHQLRHQKQTTPIFGTGADDGMGYLDFGRGLGRHSWEVE